MGIFKNGHILSFTLMSYWHLAYIIIFKETNQDTIRETRYNSDYLTLNFYNS